MQPTQPKATWSSRSAEPADSAGPLAERLAPLAGDRSSTAPALALETARVLLAWVFEQPLDWTWDRAQAALEEGLEGWWGDQGWRGSCARLADVLGRARTLEAEGLGPREVLVEELSLWGAGTEAGEERWSGAPLAPGRRLVDRAPVREHALHGRGAAGLGRGERILVLSPCDLIEPALEAAWKEGLEPRVITGEGGPHRDGLRLAGRLEAAGIEVAVTYDAALVRQVDRVDRVWLGTEATDGRCFLAPNGAEAVLVRARALEIQSELFATRDERLPASAQLTLPAWGERDAWMLWEHAPAGVEVLSGAHEVVPVELVSHAVTEVGRLAPARLDDETRWPVDAGQPTGRAALAR